MSHPATTADEYPGQSIGLPRAGRGSLASWSARLAALVIDWAAVTIICRTIFGPAVSAGVHWQMFTPIALYVVQKSLLTTLAGGSFGQLVCRLAVVRLDGQPVGWWRSAVRSLMKAMVVPAVVVGAERRALDDLALGTVVVTRR